MSGLVSYSYDPSSDQELSDPPYESQPNEVEKKVNNRFFYLSETFLFLILLFQEQPDTQNRQVCSER